MKSTSPAVVNPIPPLAGCVAGRFENPVQWADPEVGAATGSVKEADLDDLRHLSSSERLMQIVDKVGVVFEPDRGK